MRAGAAAAALFGVCATACARSGGEASLFQASPESITVLSGLAGEPVAGASVVIAGHEYRSDASGRVQPALELAGTLEVRADAFLFRETEFGRETTLTLWPTSPEYSDEYVRHLLYKPALFTRGGPSTAPDAPLHRVVAASVGVVVEQSLWADTAARSAHERAVAAINEATGGIVRFELRQAAGAGVNFRAYVDAAATAPGALTYCDLRHDTVVGGRIAYADADAARSERFVAHELGHVLGLQHSIRPSDLMYYQAPQAAAAVFSPNERLSIRMLLQRRPGNRYPDNDRAAGSGAAAAVRTVVAD